MVIGVDRAMVVICLYYRHVMRRTIQAHSMSAICGVVLALRLSILALFGAAGV